MSNRDPRNQMSTTEKEEDKTLVSVLSSNIKEWLFSSSTNPLTSYASI